MAVTAETKLNAAKLRADFPIFEQEVRGKPLAYLDSAVSSHKPRQVLDKLRNFYETSYANVHRGVYTLSEIATAEYEGAREKVAQFINAPQTRELIFTHGATESINLVAYAWGLDNLGPGDVVRRHRARAPLELRPVAVHREANRRRASGRFRSTTSGELRLDALDEIAASGNVKVVANNLVSNALGTINPVERLAAWAHEQGAIMVVDAAQAAPHHAIDVQQLGLRLPRVLVAQDVRPDERRRALGTRGAARIDVAVQSRRPHDPLGEARGDDLGTAARTSSRRERSRSPRRSASAQRSTTSPTSGSTRSSEYERELLVYALEQLAEVPGFTATARRPSGARASSRSTSTACTRTTSRRSSTWTASRSAPATTAASR